MIRFATAALVLGLLAGSAGARTQCETVNTVAGPNGSIWVVCKDGDKEIAVAWCRVDEGDELECSAWQWLD